MLPSSARPPLGAWRPAWARAAVCFSIDDVHPTAPAGGRKAGETARNALAHLEWLLGRHPQLRVTLFVTPDWRASGVYPTRSFQRLPAIGRLAYATDVLPAGTLRLDRHPGFVEFLRSLPRVDVGLHGLHHVKRGPNHLAEFEGRSAARCRAMLTRGLEIMSAAGLHPRAGLSPPAWTAPDPLLAAMAALDMSFVGSARDLETPISAEARTAGSGRRGALLVHPERLQFGRLVHVTTNFQATSSCERANAIVAAGGLLAVKAHLLKRVGSYEALDGLDRAYAQFLDRLFGTLEDAHGETLWWTTMEDAALGCRHAHDASEAAVGG